MPSIFKLIGIIFIASFLFHFESLFSQEADSLRMVLTNDLSNKEKVDVLHRLTAVLINQNPDSALIHAQEAIALTKELDDIERHSRSFRRLGHASYVSNDLHLLRKSLLDYIRFCEETDQPSQIAASYRNLSKIGESTKQPDSSLFYLDKCLEVLEEHPDSVIMVDVYLSKGLSYKYKGYFEMSLEALLNGLRISQSLDPPYKEGYLNMNLAITSYMMDLVEESAAYCKAGIANFQQDGNLRGVTRTQSNLGIALSDLEQFDNAEQAFLSAIENSKKTKMPNIAMHSFFGLAKIYYDKGDYLQALEHINKSEELARDIKDDFTIGSAARFKANLALAQGNKSVARQEVNRARDFFNSYREPIEEFETYFEMAEALEGLDLHSEALSFLKNGHDLKDSIYTLKKDQQFQELNLKYETEKKNAEITLLNKNIQLSHARQQRLWGGIGLISLLGMSIIFGQARIRRREKIIASQEREIEIEKRKRAEEKLEFKKKELTAKALQLASKNEFLQSLEEEIVQLKSSVDQSVSKASRKLSRMIHNDANEEDDWQQFGKEFSSIHQEFQDALKEKHGEFTNNEWRLISLLKMNLSSKDIANILRISTDGVKKARYRLRKKMKIDSNVDIQDYLLAI